MKRVARNAVWLMLIPVLMLSPDRSARASRPEAKRTESEDLKVARASVEAHVHFSQTGWADGRPDSLDVRARHPYEEVEADLRAKPERFFRSDLCSGVDDLAARRSKSIEVWDVVDSQHPVEGSAAAVMATGE